MRHFRRSLLAFLVLLGAAGPVSLAQASPDGAPVIVASGLDTPWEVLPLLGGRTLITERPGRIRLLAPDGKLEATPLYADATARKFLGLEPDPGYSTNRLLHLYVSRPDGSIVVRLRDQGRRLVLDGVTFPGPIPTDGSHDGGRMRFGPDGKLYVTTGDIHQPQLPQDLQSLNGKILRMNPDGSAPADNPFAAHGGNAAYVWSYGHRHMQGLAWDDRGRLWAAEHGPSGERYDPQKYPGGSGRCCRDELNLIVKGGNYGWPVVSGDDTRAGMRLPVVHAGTQAAWAPGGLAFAGDGKLYAPMLAGQHLREFTLDAGNGVAAQRELFRGARLRTATYDTCRNDLWFTGDGVSADVQRVAVGLEGRPAPPCEQPAAGGAPAASAPGAPLLATPGAGATTPDQRRGEGAWAAAARPAPATVAVRRLVSRAKAALRGAGLARLAHGRAVVLRGGGFGAGRLTVRIGLRARTRVRPLAAATRRVAPRTTVRLVLRPGPAARRALRRATRRTLTVTVAFRPAAGGAIDRTGSTRVAR